MLDRAVVGPTEQSRWRRGGAGGFLALLWLFYTVGPVSERWERGEQVRASFAAAGVVGLAVLIMVVTVRFHRSEEEVAFADPAPDRRVWWVLGAMGVLVCAELGLLGGAALPMAMYVAMMAMITLPFREAGFVVVSIAAALVIVSAVNPSWQLGGTSFLLAFLMIAIWCGREIGRRGKRLRLVAQRQAADLKIVEDRNRVARDVHDILGHSLTVITVKTELAQRLVDLDPDRAKAEMADVERLAREALAGVRDTVGGLRETTLPGELATARTALRAAGIDADLPAASDLPPGDHTILAWVLREAITNVVRHSHAHRCTVRVTATTIEITDDGTGMNPAAEYGSGLAGLRERVRAAGGTLTLSVPPTGGLTLTATFPEAP
nr:sensor histidine kinase [Nocardia transvalensis]